MLNINLSRSIRRYRKNSARLAVLFAGSVIAASQALAEDELVEFDPDNSIVGTILGCLRELWSFLSGQSV